jgi:hypothetical protein
MTAAGWYRSENPAPPVRRSLRRAARDLLLSWLPVQDVRGRVMVLTSRHALPRLTSKGIVSPFHGLFSEFHSVLGALAYAEGNGAIGVRVDFDSPIYVEAGYPSNWWEIFFEQATMYVGGRSAPDRVRRSAAEVRLDSRFRKIGRFGGFSDLVQGVTPYLYPMTFGLSRAELHRLIVEYVAVRPEILDASRRLASRTFDPDAYVVGVHYRGTDATYRWSGKLSHYRTAPVPYTTYADEVRRVIRAARPQRFQLFIATDEVEFLEFMRGQFPDAIVTSEESPRVPAGSKGIHLDPSLGFSNYLKGRSVLVDCLTLAATDYLVKGRSNVSDAALIFNPSLPYSFLPDIEVAALSHPSGATEPYRPMATDR